VLAFFQRFPPLTAGGHAAHARALLATGDRVGANAAARTAWRMGSLSPVDESAILTGFPLSPDDHDARMDALLWQNATGTAARQIGLTSAARRAVFEARLAFRTRSPNAAALSASTQALYAGDAGYVADRATWLRSTLNPEARTWLARPRSLATRPADVEEWYEVLLENARGSAADGNHQQAYDIARQIDDAYPPATDVSTKAYGERDDYTSLAWLAGWTALKRLGRPADAMPMFERYGRGSQAPQTRAKGFYWAGRAAEAAGLPQAAALYGQAARYPETFYGILATERQQLPLPGLPVVQLAPVDPATRAAWMNREVVAAARFLGQINQWRDQSAFVRQIAADTVSPTDHQLAVELSREINRPDLAVMVGRSASQRGLSAHVASGYPTVPVPGSYNGQWTMIHAIARQESQFDRAAVSSAGARGLLQLMPATAREQAGKMGISYTPEQLSSDPNISIMLGSSYFQRMYAIYGSYPLAIAAYNAGGGNVNKWLRVNGDPRTGSVDWVDWVELIPFTETRNYVQRVLENAVTYELLYPNRAAGRSATRLSWYLGKSRPG
jgi:soluble lytic murein transglycosylase